MYAHQRQSRIPEQQGIGQILPPVPVGIDTLHTSPLPSGAMPNGTRLQVGKYQVIIHNFIAEGGFAHVYLARIEGKSGYVVLKRVAVPDAERLKMVEKEIEFMRRLGNHKYIVRYYESRVDSLPIGGFEALILMEYCPGGGVIDLMNRRLQQRLTEPEILKIFGNVCEALAYMHYCQPPVLHRDLKVENILILSQDQYKLCDFGSAALSKGAYIPSTLQEIQKVEDDVQRHTTLQYRAPEMIDIYQKKPINEKADIWALGVLLYKLCYYTTPFEEQGQLAILNARYSMPQTPYFSDGLRQLIITMLQEDQEKRPNIYQVVKTVSDLMHVECPIRNIYQDITPNPPSRHESPAINHNNDSPSSIFQKVSSPPQQLPNITPMRRGRPKRQDITPTPSSPVSAPQSQMPTAMSSKTPSSAFDPFDPSQVKVHGDQDAYYTNSSKSSATSTPKNGFDNGDFSATFNNSTDDDDDLYNDAPYPYPLESQILDPISIPPEEPPQQTHQHYHQRQQQTPSSSPSLQQKSSESGDSFNSSNSASTPSTKSIKSIRDFMERKRAPYSTPSPSPKIAQSPSLSENHAHSPSLPSASVKATVEQMESSISSGNKHRSSLTTADSSPLLSVKAAVEQMESSSSLGNNSASPSGHNRPKPPPKPARFRTKQSSTTTTTDNNASINNNTTSSSPRPPSLSEFEDKFPSLDDMYTSLPSR